MNNNKMGSHFDNSYASLPEIFYTFMNLNPVSTPKLAVLNDSLAVSLGLSVEWLKSEEGIEELAGNRVPDGAMPLAQAYAGHQFGHFTMLGDGRAILLGEQVTPTGERVDIQLKGAGRTPFSRGGDGRASLGPMLREYIISEAMHALGIPTTRSLAVVTTGETVYRESELPGAILTRIASSHLRVGTFQYAAKWGSIDDLKALADYALDRHYPEADVAPNRYMFLLQEVIKRQAELIAKWQLVGFIHGVMNTDNMTISGETIDYGPCAFMDTYNQATVFSSIDRDSRYAYGNQPRMAMWNLTRLAESLVPLLDENQETAIEQAEAALQEFPNIYYANWLTGMRAKLGLFGEEKEDESLIDDLLHLMQTHSADYTNTFIALTFNVENSSLHGLPEFSNWLEKWQARLGRQQQSKEECQHLMANHNPAVIPRNHRVEEALEAAVNQGDYGVMERLLNVLASPYAHSSEQTEYAKLPPEKNEGYKTYCGT